MSKVTIKQVLEHLLKNNILIREKGRVVLSHYGYMELGEQDPQQEQKSMNALAKSIHDLFPVGVKTGALYVKSPIRSIEHKLKQYKKDYPEHTDAQIIQGVKMYVEQCRRANYAFMKTAEYFILKDRTSTLASYVENIGTEELEEDSVRGDVV